MGYTQPAFLAEKEREREEARVLFGFTSCSAPSLAHCADLEEDGRYRKQQKAVMILGFVLYWPICLPPQQSPLTTGGGHKATMNLEGEDKELAWNLGVGSKQA